MSKREDHLIYIRQHLTTALDETEELLHEEQKKHPRELCPVCDHLICCSKCKHKEKVSADE